MVLNDDNPDRSATVFQRTGRNSVRPIRPCETAVIVVTVTAPNTPRQSMAQATPEPRIAHLAAVSPIVRIRYDTVTNRMAPTVSAALSVRALAGAWADMLGDPWAELCLRRIARRHKV